MSPDENQARFYHLIAQSAQVARQQIENEGKDTPISDEARLRALNVLSYALNHAAAWDAARDLLLVMASKMEMAGHRQDWLLYLEEGLRQSQYLTDQPAEAALSFYCGHLQRLMSQYAEAEALLQSSATICASLGDQPGEAKALNQLAYLAWQQNQDEKAASLAHAALSLLRDSDPERAMSFSALGLVAFQRRQWKVAEHYHQQALVIRTNEARHREVAWSLQNVANALRAQGQYETAATYLTESIALLIKIRDPVHCAIIQMNLGIVRQRQGEIRQALALYSLAEMVFRQFNDPFNLAKTLVNQGVSYLNLQEWQQAEVVCAESAALFQQVKNQGESLNALDGLGISYLERGDYVKALAIFETIAAQLPQIKGTFFYESLAEIIESQLERTRSGMDRG